ncbi:hypothetical protein [Alteromonas flava]|uniref:hypothetical protein n=1 Tax=Alteromonas flava TaxID=2048003 RepID=UPI000C2896B4|nr:hypothetical protein [Alteromonas flava]
MLKIAKTVLSSALIGVLFSAAANASSGSIDTNTCQVGNPSANLAVQKKARGIANEVKSSIVKSNRYCLSAQHANSQIENGTLFVKRLPQTTVVGSDLIGNSAVGQ